MGKEEEEKIYTAGELADTYVEGFQQGHTNDEGVDGYG